MPKIKSTVGSRLRSFVSEFGADIFSTDGMVLFCKVGNVAVASEKKFTIQQHISRDKHARGIQRKLNEVKQNDQVLISNLTNNSDQSSFNLELCETLLAANIPLAKLNNTNIRNFLEKYIQFKIPDESTLRKNYVEKCYLNTIRNIRHYVGVKNIWVSVDETTDVEGRYVVNIVIGTLEAENSGKIFLLYSDVLEKTNHSTIAKAFDKAMFTLWPEGIKHDNVLIFVSDAAPYMVKAGRAICTLYSKMVHVTCVAHAIHRVAEEIRTNFQDVDKLISCVKKIFLKSPYRTQMFKTLAPGIPLPPEPVITRWGTWLNAVNYYCENFSYVKKVVLELNHDDSTNIKEAKKLMSESSLEANLIYIKSNFGFIPSEIKNLEASGVLLSETINTIKKIETTWSLAPNVIGETISNKLNNVLMKNNGFKVLKNISAILDGENTSRDGIPEDLTLNDMFHFKYAPVTSVDVERSFSSYKNILSDRRRSFLFENLKNHLIVQCNNMCTGKKI